MGAVKAKSLSEFPKPEVKFIKSPKYSPRNNRKINTIVLHYTVSHTAESAITTLTKPVNKGGRVASAHFIIDKDGSCYQLVLEKDKAWHAPKVNENSIGIEHVAMPGEALTPEQQKASVALCKYLMAKYLIRVRNVTGHKYTGQDTSCPGNLFGPKSTFDELDRWRKKQFAEFTF